MARRQRSPSRLQHSSDKPPYLTLASSLVCLLVASTCTLQRASAAGCPSFAREHASCSETTCGRYIYRGRFSPEASKPFLLPISSSNGGGIKLGAAAQPADCCRHCRSTAQCGYWSFDAEQGQCFLYSQGLCDSTAVDLYIPNIPKTYVGGRCNTNQKQQQQQQQQQATQAAASASLMASTAAADGAEESAAATSEDSSSSSSSSSSSAAASTDTTAEAPWYENVPDRSFCLVSDPALHLNMRLGGYLDNRTAGVAGRGRSVRVWIREVGVMWGRAGPGQSQHVVRVAARRGPEEERGSGFAEAIEVDGQKLPPLQPGDEVSLFDGQASLVMETPEAEDGSTDVAADVYTLRVEGLLEAQLTLRAAHPLLRQPGRDAMVHIMLDIDDIMYDPSVVHGVLGQSYRSDRQEMVLDYALLSHLMVPQHTQALSSASPSGLEGEPDDYVASDVSSPDCLFSQFVLAPFASASSGSGSTGGALLGGGGSLLGSAADATASAVAAAGQRLRAAAR